MTVLSWHRFLATQFTMLMLLVVPYRNSSPRCQHYWPRHVAIVGTLQRELKFGPPTYGENPATDQKYSVPILRLSHPISMCADAVGDAMAGVTEIQIQLTPARASQLYDQRIQVFGTIGPAGMAHDFTQVILTPDSVLSAPKLAERAKQSE